MTQKRLIEKSIEKKLAAERYQPPKEKKKRGAFKPQWLMVISILIGLFISLLRLLAYF